MRCGNCKGSHNTVAEVRECFGESGKPSVKQMSLAQALGRERVRLAEYAEMEEEEYHLAIGSLSRGNIGPFIDKMLKQPYDGPTREELFERIDNGKYALQNEEGDDIRFYRVSGTRRRILWELLGSPGEFRMQRIYRSEKILKRIADDPIAAFALFGLNVGACGRCGSPLTQKHTRERGIGDICYSKMTGGS